MSAISLAQDDDVDFQVKLSKVVNGMGSALVTSWNKYANVHNKHIHSVVRTYTAMLYTHIGGYTHAYGYTYTRAVLRNLHLYLVNEKSLSVIMRIVRVNNIRRLVLKERNKIIMCTILPCCFFLQRAG